MTLSRRELFAYAAAFGFSEALSPALSFAQTGPVRVREDIHSFATDPNKVAALRIAVAKMKKSSKANPNDPAGWNYWASSYGTLAAVPSKLRPVYQQCKHTDNDTPFRFEPHFLSWHRAFLFFFEQTLKQAAKDGGATVDIDLPYWDWYRNPAMPTIFAEGNDATNPLFSKKDPRLDLSNLSKAAFRFSNMLPASPTRAGATRSFSYALEDDPHGTVHDLIGFAMSDPRTAGNVPIFWVHHANIDRLWTAWMKGGTRDIPAAGSDWSRTGWNFDLDHHMSKEAGAILDTEKALGYRYDNEAMPTQTQPLVAAAPQPQPLAPPPPHPSIASGAPESLPSPAHHHLHAIERSALNAILAKKTDLATKDIILAGADKIIEAPAAIVDFHRLTNESFNKHFHHDQGGETEPAPPPPPPPTANTKAGTPLSSTTNAFSLGRSTTQVVMSLAKESVAQLHSLATGQPADLKSAMLVLDDIKILKGGENGGFSYDVVVTLTGKDGLSRRAVIGRIGKFDLALHRHRAEHGGGAGAGAYMLRYPLTEIMAELEVKNPEDLANGLSVTFEPAHAVDGETGPAFLQVGSVKILGSGAEDK